MEVFAVSFGCGGVFISAKRDQKHQHLSFLFECSIFCKLPSQLPLCDRSSRKFSKICEQKFLRPLNLSAPTAFCSGNLCSCFSVSCERASPVLYNHLRRSLIYKRSLFASFGGLPLFSRLVFERNNHAPREVRRRRRQCRTTVTGRSFHHDIHRILPLDTKFINDVDRRVEGEKNTAADNRENQGSLCVGGSCTHHEKDQVSDKGGATLRLGSRVFAESSKIATGGILIPLPSCRILPWTG